MAYLVKQHVKESQDYQEINTDLVILKSLIEEIVPVYILDRLSAVSSQQPTDSRKSTC